MARGPQVYARHLCAALDRPGERHEILNLFGPGRPGEHDLGLRAGKARELGYDLRVPIAFRRWLHEHRPTLVVTHGGETLLYVAPVLPRKTKLLHLRTGISGTTMGGRVQRAIHRFAIRRAALVGGVSEEVLDEARAVHLVPPAKLRLLANGRDPDAFVPGTGSPVRPRLAFVGHMTGTKHPERFVEVVERLRREGIDFDAVMAGDGPLLATLEPRATQAGIEVLGAVDDVPALLARCDAVCFTSQPAGEGVPGVLIEAGLCGLPVVSTEVPGAREVIADGETGAVVPVGDVDAMARTTATLLTDRELRARWGAAARKRCVERFGADVGFDQWRDVLAELLG
jgi:glycosyltransferase involved in cell wall biosynthesis